MKSNVIILLLFFIMIVNSSADCQEAYEINWKNEWKYMSAGVGSNVLGWYLFQQTEPLTYEEYSVLDGSKINRFDRIALDFNSLQSDELSDYFSNGSAILPLLVYASKIRDKEWLQSSIMYFDVLTLNTGLVTMFKYGVGRHRPYLYQQNRPVGSSFGRADSASFYSGHTSFASSNSFFAAGIFHRAYPESPAVPYVYGVAAAIPAVTGYLRVRGGAHFPSDVIVGYAAGAAVAFSVLYVHKRDDLEIGMTADGVGLVWRFY